jgi:non-canonical purine NTP pyrophosphatase (RdgB/HAM1 family)
MKVTEPLVFITGNLNKVHWTQRYIHIPLTHKKLDLTEIQSLDMKEVAEHKVREAYKHLQKPVMVEDTSLTFHAWGKLPGTYIKWFLQEIGNEGLCNLLSKDRSATATVIYAIYDGKKTYFCEASKRGTIADKPKGTSGFGWNNIFIPEGKIKTHGEMTDEEIDEISVRKMALEKLKEIL